MKYLILIPDYTGSCIRDEFQGEIAIEDLNLPKYLLHKILSWHNAYRKIIPLSETERGKKLDTIEQLDIQGIEIAKSLSKLIPGGAKVKYFSEGKLQYLYY